MKTLLSTLLLLFIFINIYSQSNGSVALKREKNYKIGTKELYSSKDIYKIVQKYKYVKDSVFDNNNNLKSKYKSLLKFQNLPEIDSFINEQNEYNKFALELNEFQNERKKVRTLSQLLNIYKKYKFNENKFLHMQIGSQEYKEFIKGVKAGTILLFIEESGTVGIGHTSNLKPGITMKIPKGRILISPE